MNETKLKAISHRRDTATKARTLRRDLAEKNAAAAIGPITHGVECFCLTAGQFSLVDVIVHVLNATGPADLTVSTWTAAGADIGFAYGLMRDGRIRRMQFLVDFSFPARQPAYCAALRQTFGDQCIRISKTHAKFCLLTNAAWNIVIRSSMNLNENRRMESLEISDDAGMAAFLQQFIDDVFTAQVAEGQFDLRPIDHIHAFEHMVRPDAKPDGAAIMQSTDARKFYSNEPFGNDLARAGLSYLKGKR